MSVLILTFSCHKGKKKKQKKCLFVAILTKDGSLYTEEKKPGCVCSLQDNGCACYLLAKTLVVSCVHRALYENNLKQHKPFLFKSSHVSNGINLKT